LIIISCTEYIIGVIAVNIIKSIKLDKQLTIP